MVETVASRVDKIVNSCRKRATEPTHIIVLVDVPLALFEQLAEQLVVALHLGLTR